MSGPGLTSLTAVTSINIGDPVNPTIANQPHSDLQTSLTMLYHYLYHDGPGSGINADLLDNQQGTYYLSLANATGSLLASSFSDTSHGSRSGGALHAAATESTNGFMSASDKAKLDSITAGANQYTLPVATTGSLGGVIVGAGLSVAPNGTISSNVSLATTGSAGIVQIGSGINVSNGVISINTSNFALLSAANTFQQVQYAPGWNTPSARELKDDLEAIDLSKYDFESLIAKRWTWKPESGFSGKSVGAIADEAQAIAPEVVGADGKSIDYGKLAFLMVAKLYAEK